MRIVTRFTARLIAVGMLLTLTAQAQQRHISWHDAGGMSMMTPGAGRYGTLGFQNPADLGWQKDLDLVFRWSNAASGVSAPKLFGFHAAVEGLAFGMRTMQIDGMSVDDYRLSLGFGEGAFTGGYGYGWSTEHDGSIGRMSTSTIGFLIRPSAHVSIGTVATATNDFNHAELAADIAIRPLRSDRLTIFADVAKADAVSSTSLSWSAGAMIEPLPGLRVSGRYASEYLPHLLARSNTISVGAQISLGRVSAGSQMVMDKEGDPVSTSYAVRIGSRDRSLLDVASRGRSYVRMDLRGSIGYQRYQIFDSRTTLAEVLEWIEAAKKDDDVRGIAINTSGFDANRELLWELRDRLRDFRTAGKKVLMFVDRPSLDLYWMASVSDRIALDPTGMILIPGYVAGRTFLKGSLEKIGVGYDEWRFFTYKSASESYSRDAMSAADREQRQSYLDDVYAQMRRDVAEGRGVPADTVDAWINSMGLFTPSEALAHGLVDTLCRWHDLKELVTAYEGERTTLTTPTNLAAFTMHRDMDWTPRKKIAVIYALGVCAMDEGIKARSLVRDVQRAVKDASIRAIVLRVDSPGGDAMASDIIAEALKEAKGKKPVIVSQGAVAGSGGYWLSMYADTIVAAPMTVTGSIGVIGGWFYDAGVKKSLGLSTDHVKAGAHGDLGFGFMLPLIGLGVPDRNLTQEERAVMERMIRSMYGEFVSKVASGRGMQNDAVDKVGQGRIWSGERGRTLGLVDELGGLHRAIRIAAERAGIDEDAPLDIVSMPEPGFIDLSGLFFPSFAALERTMERRVREVMLRLEHNGRPLMMLPLDEDVASVPEY